MRRISLFLAAAALVAVAIPAQATPVIMKKAQADKKEGVKNCTSCHDGAPSAKTVNAFGKKFATKK